jgi:hypothetical protein
MIANCMVRIIMVISLAVIGGLMLSVSSARSPRGEAAMRDDSIGRGCAVRHPSCTHDVFYGIPAQGLYVLRPEDLLS